jgi:hypothetical protein
MRSLPLKSLLFSTFILLLACSSTVKAQFLYSYHETPTRPWSLPGTLDGSAGIGQYPGVGINFMTQYAVRFTPEPGEVVTHVHFWLDSILNGVVDSTITYARPEAAFQWPVPFTHVPQRFTAHAMRFTSPLDNQLQSISIFAGSLTASSDGFNDTLKVSLLRSQTAETSVVKYGNENANNSAAWNFYFPVGTSRTAYATRFSMPAQSALAEIEFFVGGINNNSFLPIGDSSPNDSLVVSVWTSTESGLPDQKLGEVVTGIDLLRAAAWNSVSLSRLGIQNEVARELIIAFQLKVVGLIDHVGISAGTSFATPINRSLVLENGNWVTIAASSAYSSGAARGAELWTRATYTEIGQGTDPLPDEENLISEPILIPMAGVSPDSWIDIDLTSRGISFDRAEEFWVSVELIAVGTPDTFSFISGNPEPAGTGRAAARIDNGNGSSTWNYMSNTQFEKDYHFRIQADFQVPGESDLTDEVLILAYTDLEGLPNAFLGLVTVPLNALEVGAMNTVDVSELGLTTTVDDLHIAISSIFENNQFALASDEGSTDSAQNRTSAYFLSDAQWKSLASVDGSPGDVNMAIQLGTTSATTIDSPDALPSETRLMANYPNPFNPTTTIPFNLAVSGEIRLSVHDLLGREVAVMAQGMYPSGLHSIQFDAQQQASGLYLIRLRTHTGEWSRKMMLIK